MARKIGPPKLDDDTRLQRWMEWYDRNQQKSAYRRNRYAMLTEEEREEIRVRRKELYAKRIKEGWASPERHRRTDDVEYRAMVIALLVQRDSGICGICGNAVEQGQESPDHIIPKNLGGTDSAENIRLSHRLCNNRRPKRPAEIMLALEKTHGKGEALS